MDLDLISTLSDVIAATAVVVSLLVVAYQLREGNRQAKVNTALDLATAANHGFDPIYQGNNAEIWMKGLAQAKDMTDVETATFNLFMARMIHNCQQVVYAIKLGAFDLAYARRFALPFYKQILETPGGAKWLRENKALVLPEMIELLNLKDELAMGVTKKMTP